MTSII